MGLAMLQRLAVRRRGMGGGSEGWAGRGLAGALRAQGEL